MPTTLTSREFNQDIGRAKRATRHGPVFITDRGKTAHVLIAIEDYHHLAQPHSRTVEALAMSEGSEVEFEPGRLEDRLLKDVGFE
ncbi:MAG: type II toxin-antitoxin system Phd/YefM family antitoxin [SAR324 cluster bacterium]|nr:type II toxin-antitoxin system Phd/YefM family antitoxin [SAR324 cluster bacterium]